MTEAIVGLLPDKRVVPGYGSDGTSRSLFGHRDVGSARWVEAGAAGSRRAEFAHIVPVGRGASLLFHVALRILSFTEDFAHVKVRLHDLGLHAAEHGQIVGFLMLNDFVESIADSPPWNVFQIVAHEADLIEMLVALRALSLLAIGPLLVGLLYH